MAKFILRVAFNHRDPVESFVIDADNVRCDEFKKKIFDSINNLYDGEAFSYILDNCDDDAHIFAVFEIYEISRDHDRSVEGIITDIINHVKNVNEVLTQRDIDNQKTQRFELYKSLKQEFEGDKSTKPGSLDASS